GRGLNIQMEVSKSACRCGNDLGPGCLWLCDLDSGPDLAQQQLRMDPMFQGKSRELVRSLLHRLRPPELRPGTGSHCSLSASLEFPTELFPSQSEPRRGPRQPGQFQRSHQLVRQGVADPAAL